jgi:hypothetical protein
MALAGLNRDWLERIRAASVDELAPRFASVISALAEEGAKYQYADPSFFLPATVLTPGYREVLWRVRELLEQRACGSFLLNFDMGTGKTHLLTLLLHLYGVCARDPAYSPFLSRYEREELYDRQLAASTVVLAIDMRAPGEVFSKQLRFFAKQLEQVGAHKAAQIAEAAAREDHVPDARELAVAIPSHINVIVLVDELHHALIHANGLEQERVTRVVDFLTWFLNYRREYSDHRRSALVFMLASAKRDLEEWERVRRYTEHQALAVKVDSLVEQLQRVRVLSQTVWLGIGEAKAIIASRLNIGEGAAAFDQVLYGFDGLLKRVLREDTDIPQAHHLRSLIKAMAIYALNALEANDPVATPAHFSEDVAGALFLGSGLEAKYRSLYSEITAEAKGDRDLVYAVRAVFTASMTGDERKQLEMVRRYMLGGRAKGREVLDIPALKERDLQEILLKLGFGAERVKRVLDRLDGLHPRLCSVDTPEGYAYFVAPTVSVPSLYKQLIRRLESSYELNKPYVLQHLSEKLQSLVITEPNVIAQPLMSADELERLSFREDQLYLLVYADAASAADSARMGSLLQQLESFLASKRRLNVVVAVPIFGKEELSSATRYLAIQGATNVLVTNYLSPLYQQAAKGGDQLELQLFRLQEAMLYELLGRCCNEAASSLARALSKYTLLVYTQEGTVTRKDVEVVPPPPGARLSRDVAKLLQEFNKHLNEELANVGDKLAERAKSEARFLDKRDAAAAVLIKEAEVALKSGGEAVFYEDVHTYGGFYIPSRTVEEVLPLVRQHLKEKYGEIVVEERERPVRANVLKLPRPQPPAPQPTPQPLFTQPETLPLSGASVDDLVKVLQGALGATVTLEFEAPESEDRLAQLRKALYILKQAVTIKQWRITRA